MVPCFSSKWLYFARVNWLHFACVFPHREAGSYSVRWDGVTDAGLALASGVYFYRLTAGERVETRRLLLLR